jgi:hypothetical protein
VGAQHLTQDDVDPETGFLVRSVVIGIETDRRTWVSALVAAGYAGTSPITRASGTRRVVMARYAGDRHLADATHQWAFCALTD